MQTTKPPIERRVLPTEDIELRVEKRADGARMLTGYAARFNKESVDLGGFVERIAPGAFDAALKRSDVRGLVNHDPNLVIGRTKNNTLRLITNSKGLRFEVDLPDTTVGRDIATSVDRGDIDGCSFAFTTAPEGETWLIDNDRQLRVLTEVDELFDVGPVTYPAYPDTTVAARSFQAHRDAPGNEGQPVGSTISEKPPVTPSDGTDSLSAARAKLAEGRQRRREWMLRELDAKLIK